MTFILIKKPAFVLLINVPLSMWMPTLTKLSYFHNVLVGHRDASGQSPRSHSSQTWRFHKPACYEKEQIIEDLISYQGVET